MDIAEIRKKARLVQVEEPVKRDEGPSLPEEVAVAPETGSPEQAEARPEIDYATEPEVLLFDEKEQKGFGEQGAGNRELEPITMESGEQGTGNIEQGAENGEYLEPVQNHGLFTDEEVQDLANEALEAEVEVITFLLDKEEYAVDIHQVKEVIKIRELTEVPKAPKDIMGVISLRGIVIPILNLRGRLGMPVKNDGGERIIIVRDGAGLLGLLVDTVRHVIRITEKSIEPPPAVNTIDGNLLSGIGRYKGGMFILLDIQKILE